MSFVLLDKGMRTFLAVSFPSFGVSRVVIQLEKYLPSDFTIANDPTSADLTVLHVIGRHDHNLERAKRILDAGHQYAVIQYSLKSTRNPDPKDWLELWNNAKVVWSYYDLRQYIPNMYLSPLGVNAEIFYKENGVEEKYLLGTNANGSCYQAECIGEARLAVHGRGRMLHIGEPFGSDPSVDSFKNVSDDKMRQFYNQCRWFSALRRKDGFELVAAEALLCGTRPILFDTPNYRQWFDGLAKFIPESSVGDTVRNLIKILKGEARPVTDEEIAEVKERFNWESIARGFWERCR
jgi:hypothetical protein